MSKIFRRVVIADFEYEVNPGNLPIPLCMVVYLLNENLQHEKTIRIWRGEFGSRPPFDLERDLFVAYSAWAELTCFLVLGWRFPKHVFDLHTAYLAASNFLLPYEPDEKRKKQSRGLSAACRCYGIPGWENIDKEQMSKDIGEGRWRDYGQDAVFQYCEEDVANSTKLLRELLSGNAVYPPASAPHVIHWSNYSAKAIALIQARGIPIDMELWNLLQENRAAVVEGLIQRLDPSQNSDCPIYTPEGEFSYDRFERWLALTGVHAWPRLASGRLDTDSDAFGLMQHIPGIEDLHALRDSIGFIAKARLPIGSDGRNRPSLFPFGTATGRNAHRKSPYNAHAGVRSVIAFPRDKIGIYLDWRTQEVGVAAALSEDQALIADYSSGDIYHALAKLCGSTQDPDPKHWKDNNPESRQQMKPLQLGINYGMGVPSLAKGLDRHPIIASQIIERHRRTYPRFWEWRANMVKNAMLTRRIESVFGWPLYITSSPNKRTLYNFPMQANGAEMLRLAAVRLCDAGLVPSMLIHDGILLELDDAKQIEHVKEIMRQAGRDVCNGLEIGVDEDQKLIGGAHYADKRPVAKKMWATIMGALNSALKRSA